LWPQEGEKTFPTLISILNYLRLHKEMMSLLRACCNVTKLAVGFFPRGANANSVPNPFPWALVGRIASINALEFRHSFWRRGFWFYIFFSIFIYFQKLPWIIFTLK
jgi:hypothetical protein